MNGIFISYRRDDSAGYAGRLYDRLAGHFGPERVFMDVEGIAPGLDFVEAIEQAVSSCQVLIVVIGDEWATIADSAGRRRLDDAHDFIRLETGTALRRKIRVVPVLVGGAVMPRVDELPDDIKALTRRQAVEVNHKQWDASTGELIRALEVILGLDEAPPVPSLAVASTAYAPSAAVPDVPAVRSAAHNETADSGPHHGAVGVRTWLTVAAGLVMLAAIWWGFVRPRDAPAKAASDATSQAATARPASSASASRTIEPGPAVALAPEPHATVSQTLPSAPSSATRAPAESAAAAVPKPVPAPAPGPGSAPGPAAATAPLSGTAPAQTPNATPMPTIRAFTATAAGSQVRVCYRVSDATRLELAPQPGDLARTDQDCVTVAIDAPTLFTLTARRGNQSTSKRLAVMPAAAGAPTRPDASATASGRGPVPAATATARADAAAGSGTASPAAAPAPATSPQVAPTARPVAGERWIYSSSGKWRTSAQRRIEIVARSVAGTVVTDALNVLVPETVGGAELQRSRGDRPDFIAWSSIGPEFSPYFGAFVDLLQQGLLSGLATPDLDPQWTGWYSEARVLGRESVQVPAGRFDAIKVEVWSTRGKTGTFSQARLEPVRVHYLVWYAAQTKRYVRMQRRITTADSSESEKDVFELLSHHLP